MGLEMFQLHNKIADRLNAPSWQIRETNLRLAVGIGIMFFYLLIGAIVFVQIEGPAEVTDFANYNLLRDYWDKRLNNASQLSEAEIDEMFADIRNMALKGVWREKNVTSDYSWTFGQAFFFSGALISTVGYGRVSPRTKQGKFFTIIYCIVGIPLTLALLSSVVVRLRQPSIWLREKLNQRFGHLFRDTQIQIFHLILVSSLLLIFVFIIPSYIFEHIEKDWEFLDAFYYCFVSLTTIGLGEYVPGDKQDQSFRGLYKFLVTVYLLVGLCCMMLFLATFYSVKQLNLTRFFLIRDGSEYTDPTDDQKLTIVNQNYDTVGYSRQFDDDSPETSGFYQRSIADRLP
uniref:Two pore potassium channel protein sup-9 n=1 Tax=Syphacia muris TaxID=451379 RepID=A0A0N5AWJ0_9BILA